MAARCTEPGCKHVFYDMTVFPTHDLFVAAHRTIMFRFSISFHFNLLRKITLLMIIVIIVLSDRIYNSRSFKRGKAGCHGKNLESFFYFEVIINRVLINFNTIKQFSESKLSLSSVVCQPV